MIYSPAGSKGRWLAWKSKCGCVESTDRRRRHRGKVTTISHRTTRTPRPENHQAGYHQGETTDKHDAACLVGERQNDSQKVDASHHRVEAFAIASANSSVELVRSRATNTVKEKYWFMVIAPVTRPSRTLLQ
jgi:hypothetical protein